MLRLIRVCNGGNDNSVYWRIYYPNPCTLVDSIKIFARDASSSPFVIIGSGVNPSLGQFLHINANVPGVKPWEYFVMYELNCSGVTTTFYTDTLPIDDQKPDSTVLDSVSVDPITGVVYLGWQSNRTSDFSSYYLYNYDRPDPRLKENYKDTFYTDITPANPKSKPLSYDITSSDSCDNRKDYGKYQHKTINLKGTIDTCVGKISLTWSGYVGWPVRVYEIFKSTSPGSFTLIDTVGSAILSYTDFNIPASTTFNYFVRAKSTVSQFSSTSNSIDPITSGVAVKPTGTKITYITNNTNSKLEIKIARNPVSNYGDIGLFRARVNSSPVFIHKFQNAEEVYEDPSAQTDQRYSYVLFASNVCGIVTDTSDISNNILLQLETNEAGLSLRWCPYFTWNSGVEKYAIYRASGNTVAEATNFIKISELNTDTSISDNTPIQSVQCYYVVAHELGSSTTSKSNNVCYIRTGGIYFPNAIVTNGINNTFQIKGEGIDLQKSSIQIFNRWGQLEYSKEDISNGWNGRNNSGDMVPGGVYFFTAQISQGTQMVNIHGNITVLN